MEAGGINTHLLLPVAGNVCLSLDILPPSGAAAFSRYSGFSKVLRSLYNLRRLGTGLDGRSV